MYVCVCNAITLRQVRSAAEQEGYESAAAYLRAKGVTPQCGKCVPEIQTTMRARAVSRLSASESPNAA